MRRGQIFLINVGVPVVTAVALGQSQVALLGGMGALVLSFADNEKELPGRLALLAGVAASMALGGLCGFFLRNHSHFFWPVFLLIVFGVGMAARAGRDVLIASRNGAVAFSAMAGVTGFETFDLWLLGGVVLLNVLTRITDHLIFGPLPRIAAGPQPQRPSGHIGWLRFALAYALATGSAMWIGLLLDPSHAVWVVATTLLVMQADARASYQRILERVEGTFAGVVVAWGLASLVRDKTLVTAMAVLVVPFIPHHVGQRYWLHTALVALFILLVYDISAASVSDLDQLLGERLKDMLLGCTLAVVGTAIAFPRDASDPPANGS
jgi:hypothetical protein